MTTMKTNTTVPVLFCVILSLIAGKNLKAQDLKTMSVTDDNKFFYLYGTSAINSSQELIESATASQKFSGRFDLKKPVDGSGFNFFTGYSASIGMNVINLKPADVDKDSIDLISLMFPETGNFGFMGSLGATYFYNEYSDHKTNAISCDITFCLRQAKVSNIPQYDSVGNFIESQTINFSVLNFNIMPFKYTWRYKPDANFKAEISIGLYYHFFTIPKEDARDFNKLFPVNEPLFDVNKTSVIRAIGIKIAASINDFIIFADLRNNYVRDEILVPDNNPFKGFVFNAGFATDLVIFSR